jgi:hypothetical protein
MHTVKPFKNAYLAKWDDDEVIFRRPLYVRIGAALCAVLLATLPIILIWATVTDQSASNRRDPTTLAMLLFVSVVLITGLVCSLYGTGPCSLLVNLRRRTYRFQEGFPLLATVTEGPLEDIACLYPKSVYRVGFCIFLKWKNPRRINALFGQTHFFLGTAASDGEAQAQTMQIADKFGVPPSRFGSMRPPGTHRESPEASPWHHLHHGE